MNLNSRHGEVIIDQLSKERIQNHPTESPLR